MLIIFVVVVVAIWDGIWKLIALWKSARNDQMAWFICLAIFNTAGILPILYIWLFQKKAPAGKRFNAKTQRCKDAGNRQGES